MKYRKLMELDVMHTIYQVMLKRISKGYSAEELSFLMGCETDFVSKVEALQVDGYGPQAIKLIAKALDEHDMSSFYAKVELSETCDVEMEQIVEAGLLIHRCTRYQDEIGTTSFILNETVHAHPKGIAANNSYFLLAKDALRLLLDSGYFYVAKSNQQIFNRINRFVLTGTLSPFLVEQALHEFCNEETGLLRRIRLAGKEGTFVEC